MFSDNMNMQPVEQPQFDNSPLNKRRRFAPDSLPIIASEDNGAILNHVFDSPLLLQLCEQSPSQQEIEAQLLQVGMRVRKSVNEGYKKTRAFTPRPFFNSSRLSPETISALCGSQADEEFSAGGLHKVGNMAMQPISTATFCGINLAALSHISDNVNFDQQQLWTYSTSSKRSLGEESDSDDGSEFMPRTPQLTFADAGTSYNQDYFNINTDNMIDVGSLTQIGQARRLAKPRSRLGRQVSNETFPTINPFAEISERPTGFGHKRMTSCGFEAKMDFGEAPFLQPRQDVEMDWS